MTANCLNFKVGERTQQCPHFTRLKTRRSLVLNNDKMLAAKVYYLPSLGPKVGGVNLLTGKMLVHRKMKRRGTVFDVQQNTRHIKHFSPGQTAFMLSEVQNSSCNPVH